MTRANAVSTTVSGRIGPLRVPAPLANLGSGLGSLDTIVEHHYQNGLF
ncbi:hypothetical protein [Streptomyces lydicus]|nr:hypothetical protein [Streptomyces lydicus]